MDSEEVLRLKAELAARNEELRAAEDHIAQLETKLLDEKDLRQELKRVQLQNRGLRKSSKRRLSRFLLAPFRRQRSKNGATPTPIGDEVRFYQAWLEEQRAQASDREGLRSRTVKWAHRPLISIITPVSDTRADWLRATLDSVRGQIYERWELILVDDGSEKPETLEVLRDCSQGDDRVSLLRLKKRGGIALASNAAIDRARGEWIAFLDHDDLLEPDALFRMIEHLQSQPETDVIYSDEDKITADGFSAPLFKPDWSPQYFESHNYIAHLLCLRRALVEEAGGFRAGFDGAQDYDLLLRIAENTPRIEHVPRVLYHWRRTLDSTADNIRRKPGALEAGRRALQEHLERSSVNGRVRIDWPTHLYRVRPMVADCSSVDAIIPPSSSEAWEEQTFRALRSEQTGVTAKVILAEGPDAAALNGAVAQGSAPYLLFLQPDLFPLAPEWLRLMLEQMRSGVGAVGPLLLDADGQIYGAGIVLDETAIAVMAFRGFPADSRGVNRQLKVTRNYSAVSGQCLLTTREHFLRLGGFDAESFPCSFYDVDYCLRLEAAGARIVYCPDVTMKMTGGVREEWDERAAAAMRAKWLPRLRHDPYYNANLSRDPADFSLAKGQFQKAK